MFADHLPQCIGALGGHIDRQVAGLAIGIVFDREVLDVDAVGR